MRAGRGRRRLLALPRFGPLSWAALTVPLPVALFPAPLQEEDPEKYQAHFAEYLKAGVEPDDLEDLYTKVRAGGAWRLPRMQHCPGQPAWRPSPPSSARRARTVRVRAEPSPRAAVLLRRRGACFAGALGALTRAGPRSLPSVCPQVHEAIREDPAAKPKARSKPAEAKRWKEVKLTYDQVRPTTRLVLSTCAVCCCVGGSDAGLAGPGRKRRAASPGMHCGCILMSDARPPARPCSARTSSRPSWLSWQRRTSKHPRPGAAAAAAQRATLAALRRRPPAAAAAPPCATVLGLDPQKAPRTGWPGPAGGGRRAAAAA